MLINYGGGAHLTSESESVQIFIGQPLGADGGGNPGVENHQNAKFGMQ